MTILFINPPFYLYGAIAGHGGHLPPLNLLYLAAFFRKHHPEIPVQVLDADVMGLTLEQTIDYAIACKPDIIGITANTCAFTHVIHLCRGLKERLPQTMVVIGGPHVSALRESAIEETGADFGIFGEGEQTFLELAEWRMLSDPDDALASIRGLVYRDVNNNIRANAPRELIKDIDTIPYPALDLVDTRRYEAAPTKRVALGFNTMICTSRGCPHNCGFCGAQATWTRRVRKRSAENVLGEIAWVQDRFNAKSINFSDEFFTADLHRVRTICEGMLERKLVMPWVCMARAERLDEPILRLMKKAGCREISFGIESGNPNILQRIDKRLDLKKAEETVRLTRRVGIRTHASYIIGYLEETEDTIRDTINFAKNLNTDVAAFFIASPLPGTAFYREAIERGFLRKNFVWEHFSPLSNADSVVDLPGLDADRIRQLHRKAIRDYYLRPGYVFQWLLRLRNWHEIINLFNGLRLFFAIRK